MARVHDAIELVDQGTSVAEACEKIGVSRQSVYAELQRRELKLLRLKEKGLKPCPHCQGTGSVPMDPEDLPPKPPVKSNLPG